MFGEVKFDATDTKSYVPIHGFYSSATLKNLIQRHCFYMRQSPYSNLKDRILPLVWMAAGGAAGFWVATKVANEMKLTNSRPAVQGGGTIMGCCVGAYAYACIKEGDLFFKTWKELRLNAITDLFLGARYQKDPFLHQFVDCISYEFLRVPVRLQSGYLIDLGSFKSLPLNNQGEIVCPHRCGTLSLSNPHIDCELHTLILKRFQFLLKEDIRMPNLEAAVEEGYRLQLSEIERALALSYRRHIQALEALAGESQITDEELDYLRAEFYQDFGRNPLGHASPALRVVPHVMDFTKDWKESLSRHSEIIFKNTPPTQFMDPVPDEIEVVEGP